MIGKLHRRKLRTEWTEFHNPPKNLEDTMLQENQ